MLVVYSSPPDETCRGVETVERIFQSEILIIINYEAEEAKSSK